MNDRIADAVVIGGGFYGAVIAAYLSKQRGLKHVIVIEKESELLKRASYNNQARVHNGYHYPRSLITAFRSRVNLPKFIHDWPQAIKKDFTKLYAIARRNSNVTSKNFLRFCNEINASARPARHDLKGLFNQNLIESVFEVDEYAFDSTLLASWAEYELRNSNVQIYFRTTAKEIIRSHSDDLVVRIVNEDNSLSDMNCRYVFNCSYSGLNQISGGLPPSSACLKHEITEMALIKVPAELAHVGITVMDGPFFSLMPFPPRSLHTLSHVRYTPHFAWEDERGIDPYEKLRAYEKTTQVDRMLRDAARYLPSISNSNYIESQFEIKTILSTNEVDDGRPILFEKYKKMPGCYLILGGKIDNVYDVLEKLDSEDITS